MVMIEEKDNDGIKTGKKFPVLSGFRAIPVFRYEDTEGCPLKEYKPKALPPLLNVAKKWGVDVRYDDTSIGEWGSYNPKAKEIRLCTEEAGTFFHELAHLAHMKIDGKLKQGQDPEQERGMENSRSSLGHNPEIPARSRLPGPIERPQERHQGTTHFINSSWKRPPHPFYFISEQIGPN